MTEAFQSPDGETWYRDDRETVRVVRVENEGLYRVEPQIEVSNGWYRLTGYRIADLAESRRLGTAVVHQTRKVLRSATGRFGFTTSLATYFDGRIVDEADGSDADGDLGPLGAHFEAEWAPFAAILSSIEVPSTLEFPQQPATPWDPRLAG